MSRTMDTPARHSGRCRPRLERLESRLTLNGSPAGQLLITAYVLPISAFDGATDSLSPNLSVLSTDPAAGASLTQGPSTVSVTFDRPVDPFSLFGSDILIQARQGTHWDNLFDSTNAPAETLDDSGLVLTLTLPQPLAPGHYRLALPEFSLLAGLDGSSVADNGADQVLAGFTVTPPGVTFHDAQDLGTVFDQPIIASGVLDLTADPGVVALYKFNVAPGHHWRLAAEVSAQRIGSALTAQLTLFDANGKPLVVANADRPDAPNDPYLFAGLDPGTYYLGISGMGNIPGTAGGYDPLIGRHGTSTGAQTGGAFSLNVVADPADSAVRLLGATTDHADPADPTPTGLTLAFSGLLNTETLRGDPTPGFSLVDQHGQTFPMTAVGFHESSAQYYFLFDQPLPAGRYTVLIPDQAHGGATDLAGLSPVAPGQPSGVLMNFTVSAGRGPRDPHDLGNLYVDVHTGISRSETVPAHSATTYRFANPTAGLFQLQTTDSAGNLRVLVIGAETSNSFVGGAPGKVSSFPLFYLEDGVAYLQFVNTGKTATTVTFTLLEVTGWESLLANGVGQGPALNLRFVSPTSASFGGQVAATPANPTVSTSPMGPLSLAGSNSSGLSATRSNPGTESSMSGLTAASGSASGLFLSVGNALVGRPVSTAENAGASGGGGGGETVASAGGASAVPQTLASFSLGLFSSTDGDDAVPDPSGQPSSPQPINGALVAEAAATNAPTKDDALVVTTDLLTRIGEIANRWLSWRREEVPVDLNAEPKAEPIVLTRDDSPTAHEDGRVERAQLAPSLVVGIASLLTFRYHQPFRRWLSRTAEDSTSRRSSRAKSPIVRGPHTRL